MKTIQDFEVINHGIQYPDYFQGCGTAFTEFDDVATGVGNSELDAIDDAMEMLAQNDWETDGLLDRAVELYGKKPSTKCVPRKYGDEANYFVSIRVR